MPALLLLQLAATELRRLTAPEAHQGAAVTATSVYAVDNSRVARYDRASGRRVALWQGNPTRFPHVNSCAPHGRDLVCAGSNYPAVPMRSYVVRLDATTLALRDVRDLPGAPGSLTWLDRQAGHWWAGFAHYDGKGGAPGRDHRDTVVVRYTPDFVEQGRWRFPDAVLARFAPRSTSGGAWGQDGLLYVTGHDRPELYALRVPARPGTMALVATVATPTGGQAFGRSGDRLWTIDRNRAELVESAMPKLPR